jgi:hypothetical protein
MGRGAPRGVLSLFFHPTVNFNPTAILDLVRFEVKKIILKGVLLFLKWNLQQRIARPFNF